MNRFNKNKLRLHALKGTDSNVSWGERGPAPLGGMPPSTQHTGGRGWVRVCKHACMPAHACAPSAPGTPKTRLPTNNAINPQDQVCPAPGAQRPATPCQSFWEQVGPPECMLCRPLLATTALGASLPAEGADDGTRALPVLLGKPLAFMPSFTHSLVLRTLPEHLDPTRLSPDAWAASTHSERPRRSPAPRSPPPRTRNRSPGSHLGSIADQCCDLGSVTGPPEASARGQMGREPRLPPRLQ